LLEAPPVEIEASDWPEPPFEVLPPEPDDPPELLEPAEPPDAEAPPRPVAPLEPALPPLPPVPPSVLLGPAQAKESSARVKDQAKQQPMDEPFFFICDIPLASLADDY